MLKWLDKYIKGHDGFIAGGCFKQIFTGQPVKDIDIFFETEGAFEQAERAFRHELSYINHYETDKVIAFKDSITDVVVELVKMVKGSPREILDAFDFTITKFAYFKKDVMGFSCLYSDMFFEHLMFKRLVVDNRLIYPANTFNRMFKYAHYGYLPCRETKSRVAEALRALEVPVNISASLYDGPD